MIAIKIQLIDESFEKIRPNLEKFTVSFYENLLNSHPELKPMFAKTNISEQSNMLMGSLILAVKNIHKPELIATTLKKLGGRHVKYGASSEYYSYFGEALLATLKEYLKEDWNPTLALAWRDAYESIVRLMLEGATAETKKRFNSIWNRKKLTSH
ncbi:MAG: globin family protein [Prochloraceae cyanobacterium]